MTKQTMVSVYVRQARGMQTMALRLDRWGRHQAATAYREMAHDLIAHARTARNLAI